MSVDHLSPTKVPFSGKKRSPALSPRTKRIISFVISFLICFATWIVLSGRFDLFHIGLGVIACVIVASLSGNILIARRGLQ